MNARNTLFIALVFCLSGSAQAEVYKCRLPDGRTEISNTPCAGAGNTLKAVPDDVVPAAAREKAEREAEQRRTQAERLETARRAREKEESELQAKTRKEEVRAAPLTRTEECLRTVSGMTLEAARRAELEAACLTTGALPSPPVTPVLVPYYPPTTLPPPRPKPKPPVTDPSEKPPGYYSSPDKYKVQ